MQNIIIKSLHVSFLLPPACKISSCFKTALIKSYCTQYAPACLMFSLSVQQTLSQRECTFTSIHLQCNGRPTCLPSRQCQPRLEKVFLSSSWTSHRVSKQTLPNLTGLNKARLAAVMRASQSGHIGTASCQHRGGKYINITIRHHHLTPGQSPNNSEAPPADD